MPFTECLLNYSSDIPAYSNTKHFTKEKRRYVKGLQRRIITGTSNGRAARQAELERVDLMTEFALLLEDQIPRLRRYARALSRDATRADDLVQSCLLRALAKQHLWQAGTDLRAWLFTILHNLHVNEVRRALRDGSTVPVEDLAAELPVAPNFHDSLELRDLDRAIGRLPDEQRQVILLVGLEGMRYEEVAKILGIPIGTVRSRLSRGRETLRVLMGMHEATAAAPEARQSASAEREAA
ncbi:MAG TPA: sigma-70 family RNA polymerase sigma factor [Xanthobacteraceae bacterium]|nr:sigma-70 family RNA polymerase sigma factor [Xanthobacteraceae bacterium]